MFDLSSLISHFGLFAVFGTAAVEGDAAVVTAGVLVQRGVMPFWPVVIAGMAGGWFSDMLIYSLARRYREHPRTVRAVKAAREWRLFNLCLAWPMLLAFAIRFMPGVRTIGPVALATASQISPLRYTLMTGVAAFFWSLILMLIGQKVGQLLAHIFNKIGAPQALSVAIPVAIVLVLTVIAIRKWRKSTVARDV